MYQSESSFHSCLESYYLVCSDFDEAALVSVMMKAWANRPGFTRLVIQVGRDVRCQLIGTFEGTNLPKTSTFDLCYSIVSQSSFSSLCFPLGLICESQELPSYF